MVVSDQPHSYISNVNVTSRVSCGVTCIGGISAQVDSAQARNYTRIPESKS